MKRVLLILLVATALSGCTQSNDAVRILESAGYSNITLEGYAWLSCSEDDTYATAFKATGPTGKPVSGAVCSGLFMKNSTIRLD